MSFFTDFSRPIRKLLFAALGLSPVSGIAYRSVAPLSPVSSIAYRNVAPPSPPAAVRSTVAFDVHIDTKLYRTALEDAACQTTCLALQRSLADTVMGLLRNDYPFINWTKMGASVTDTVIMSWVDENPTQLQGSRLKFVIRSNNSRIESNARPFESNSDFNNRKWDKRLWHPDTLRRQWLLQLKNTLIDPELLLQIFGRIPILADPTLQRDGRALVPVSAADIGMDSSARPVFRVRARVVDNVNNTADDGDFKLGNCLKAATQNAFSCAVTEFTYPTQPPMSGADLKAFMQRAVTSQRKVYLLDYATPTRPSKFNGASLPKGMP